MAVGGMPQAVEAFVSGRSYQEIDFVKRNILRLYEEDLRKADGDHQGRTTAVFKRIPEQLSNHNSTFRYAMMGDGSRYSQYADAVDFIGESMMGNVCVNVTEPTVAPELFADRSRFKLYMGDTGLLVTQIMESSQETDESIYKSLIFDKLGLNQGMIVENIVGQMLRSSGYDLYFHEFRYQPENSQREKKYEVDFLLVKGKRLFPVEVKSSGYASHKSFDFFLKKYPVKPGGRYIIYTKDLKQEDDIIFLPVYMTMCL
jgi:hypothetical protein